MKNKYKTKKHFSTFLAAISCFILLLSISSCEFFTFSDLKEKENAANATEQLNSEKIYKLHITPRFGNENLYNQTSSRSAYPDFSSFSFLDYTFKATSSVLAQDAAGTYNSQSGDISYSFSAPTSSEPVDFTFYICDLSGKELFYGTQQITYTTLGAEISKTVYFKSYNSSEVNGHIDLKVAVTSGYTLSCEINNSSDESVCGNTGDPISVDSSGNITTGTDGIDPGTYKAYISVNKGSQLYDYIIQEINVWPGLTTNRWYLPDGTTSQTYNIEISENKIKLYVKGSGPSGLYGSSGLTGVAEPLDTNSGAIMHPLASLSAAISKCTDSSTQYTIICDGSIAGCNIGSQSTPNDCTITIRGGGNSSGYSRISTRGLIIYTNKAITLENIKISVLNQTAIQYTSSATSADLSLKNCEITNNKMTGNVGGIKLNSANLHLQGKIVITGNVWRNNSSDTTGSPKNVVLNSPNLIIIDGPLDSSSRIGVTYSELLTTSFCPGFATSCPGLDPKIIFSADFDEYEIKENGDDDPCLARLPLYAEVNAKQYYTLSATVNEIKDSSGTITVVLYGPVSQTDLGPSRTEGTILNAIKSKTSNDDSVNLSVATGESITLTGSLKEYFSNCARLTSVNLTGFNTANVTSMESMFNVCNGLSSLDLTGFNTANVTSMESMFRGCYDLSSLDLSGFNTANVTSMKSMFYGCNGLNSLDLSGFNTANVTDMDSMFCECYSLSSLNISGFNTANVTDMDFMFGYCSLETLDLSSFNTANVTSMEGMFCDCYALSSLDLSGFNTANVTSMWVMFKGCRMLETLDLSNFNTSNVTDMRSMFEGCEQLHTVLVSSLFVTSSVTGSEDMFKDAALLQGGAGTTYSGEHIDASYARIDGGPSTPGYFTAVNYIGNKHPTAQKEVGDIVFNDGSAMPYTDFAAITDTSVINEKKAAAIALIFYKGTGLNSGSDSTTSRTLGVGLKHDREGLTWCSSGANAFNTNITTIQCPPSGSAGSYTFTGDKNGSDNLEQIEDFEGVDDTATATKYFAFYFGKKYATETAINIEATSEFATGWYLPSIAELYQIYACRADTSNGFNIETASQALGGDIFGTYETPQTLGYWSSTQYESNDYKNNAYVLDFSDGSCTNCYKGNGYTYVCCIRAF